MGLSDLFRPRWKHSNAEVRAQALRELAPNSAELSQIAREDPNPQIRRAALKRITVPETLDALAVEGTDSLFQREARELAQALRLDLLIGAQGEKYLLHLPALDARALLSVAKRATGEPVRRAALARITAPEAFAELARKATDETLRLEALAQVNDPTLLAEIALRDPARAVVLAALERISEPKDLVRIATKAHCRAAREAAKARLPSPDATVPSEEARSRALAAKQRAETKRAEEVRQVQALEAAQAQRLQREQAIADQKREAAEHARAEKEAQRAAEQAAALARAQEEQRAVERAAEKRQQQEAQERAALDQLSRRCAEIEHWLETEPPPQAEQRLYQLQQDLERSTLPRFLIDPLLEQFRTRRKKLSPQLEEREEAERWKRWANVSLLEKECERVEKLLSSTDWAEAARELKAARDAWHAIGPVPREKQDMLDRRFKTACGEVQGLCRAYFAAVDRQRRENLAKKEELCRRAEELAESSDWRAAAEAIKALQAEWKSAPAGRQDRPLWERFRSACDRFFSRRKAEFEQADAERAANLTKKLALCEQAEKLGELEDLWEAQNQAKRLQTEWKRVGQVPRAETEPVWKRFRAACDRLFETEAPPAEMPTTTASRFENRLPLEKLAEQLKVTGEH